MAYTNFTLPELKKQFQLTEITQPLFATVEKLEPSDWLKQTLAIGLSEHLLTEKERSERLVSPILFDLRERKHRCFSIYSGVLFEVDKNQGLNGECDFLLTVQPARYTIESPIFCLVEAQDNDIKIGLPQCLAQMIGAKIFNQQEGNPIEVIYGSVTTGEDWQFLKLENNTVVMNPKRYYIDHVEEILGLLQKIVDVYLPVAQ
jgi:hypothetical protein